ncbi:dihydropteroate synthase [Aestuariibius sp. HNIBRBA575]|uniref:dihydropteroate synthase n=1 Tax=Aestuariibius sp. HNIBRBA575 TaxID=3233343 RepID=UPI0034A2631C
MVTDLAGDPDELFLPEDLSADLLTKLTQPRADICGLSMDRPRIMGILNVTPDSFSDGGDHDDLSDAIARAQDLSRHADIIDIGGESTRPGAKTVDTKEEIQRTAPVIHAIRNAGITTPISIDTRKADVAQAALDAGADMINDVSALSFDPEIGRVAARADVPICLMHAQGDPATMQKNPYYSNVVTDVYDYLGARINAALEMGIKPERIITDPGIGFGKTVQHNLNLLRHLSLYHALGCPILLGASRKRFIGTLSQTPDAKDRMPGSVAVALFAARQGAQILRVHDITETRQALTLELAINADKNEDE